MMEGRGDNVPPRPRIINKNHNQKNKINQMEVANCEVRLLGDLGNSVPKQGVTPAEALILKTIHGPDSVIKVSIVGSDKRPHKDEYARLESIYGQTVSENGTLIFNKIFPQQFDPKLPLKFSEVGIEIDGSTNESFVPDIPDTDAGADDEEGAKDIEVEPDHKKEPLQKKRGK